MIRNRQYLHLSRIQLREIQYVVNKGKKKLSGHFNVCRVGESVLFGALTKNRFVHTEYGVYGSSYLVRHGSQKFGLKVCLVLYVTLLFFQFKKIYESVEYRRYGEYQKTRLKIERRHDACFYIVGKLKCKQYKHDNRRPHDNTVVSAFARLVIFYYSVSKQRYA